MLSVFFIYYSSIENIEFQQPIVGFPDWNMLSLLRFEDNVL